MANNERKNEHQHHNNGREKNPGLDSYDLETAEMIAQLRERSKKGLIETEELEKRITQLLLDLKTGSQQKKHD